MSHRRKNVASSFGLAMSQIMFTIVVHCAKLLKLTIEVSCSGMKQPRALGEVSLISFNDFLRKSI